MRTVSASMACGNEDNLGRVYIVTLVFTKLWLGFREPQRRVQCPGAMLSSQVWRGKVSTRWLEAGDREVSSKMATWQEPWLWVERWSCSQWHHWEGAGGIKAPIYTSSPCLLLASIPHWPNLTRSHWTYRLASSGQKQDGAGGRMDVGQIEDVQEFKSNNAHKSTEYVPNTQQSLLHYHYKWRAMGDRKGN